MIALLELVPRWLLLAATVALAVLAGWNTYQLADARGDLLEARQEVSELHTAIAQANTEAAKKSAALQSAVVKAQNEAKTREIALRAAAAAAATESDGLRVDVENLRGQLTGVTREAAAERALAIGTVLGQCAAQHQDLAQRCDRHVSDIRTLIEAWPK